MPANQAKFQIGQIVHHRLFDYVGVIYDIDPMFSGTDDWYEHVAQSRPPRDEPWYHVLVNNAAHTTYVAEKNLEVSDSPRPIEHPLTDELLGDFDGECYGVRHQMN